MLRKTWTTLALIIVLFVCQATSLAASRPRLDVRTMKDWSIVVAETAIESEKYAAEEFRDFFAQATGYRLPIRSDSAAETKNVFIGASDALAESNLAHALDRDYAEEELRTIIEQDNIAIVGGRPRGVLYGVYQFLEQCVGVRFLAPDYTYVPVHDPDDTYKNRAGRLFLADYTYNPPVECRFPAFKDLPGRTGQFAARLRMNGRFSGDGGPPGEWRKKIGFNNRKGLILHNISSWVPFKKEQNPEYFSPLGGNPQPCFSHPAVIKGMTERVLSVMDRDFGPNSMIPIAHADAMLCYCQRCQDIIRKDGLELTGASGESSGAPMFLTINHIAREVAKTRPDLTIATYAYTQTAVPPMNIKMEPNVRIQYALYNACLFHQFDSLSCPMNMQYLEDMRKWGEISNGVMYWYYGMGSYVDYTAPPFQLRMAGSHLRTLVANNGKSIFVQGGAIIFNELVQYVYARLLWDPNLNTHEVISEFMDLYYGKAAPPIAEFISLAEAETRLAGNHPNSGGPNILEAYNFSQDLGRRGIELFNEALALAESAEVKARVAKASLSAYRLSLGDIWLGKPIEGMTDQDKAKYRRLARKALELCEQFEIVALHEGRRIEHLAPAMRNALGMAEDAPF